MKQTVRAASICWRYLISSRCTGGSLCMAMQPVTIHKQASSCSACLHSCHHAGGFIFTTSSLHHGPAKQMRKLKLREVKSPPPGHPANERWTQVCVISKPRSLRNIWGISQEIRGGNEDHAHPHSWEATLRVRLSPGAGFTCREVPSPRAFHCHYC